MVGPGTGSARSNKRGVFALAEILRAKQFRQAYDLSAAPGGLADKFRRPPHVRFGVGTARHLYETDTKCLRHFDLPVKFQR